MCLFGGRGPLGSSQGSHARVPLVPTSKLAGRKGIERGERDWAERERDRINKELNKYD